MSALDHRYLDREILYGLFPLYNHSVQHEAGYNNYNELIGAGFVEISETDDEWTSFRITEKGKKVLDDIVDEFARKLRK